jgi:tetratricopeptide (TPR) repeat protein
VVYLIVLAAALLGVLIYVGTQSLWRRQSSRLFVRGVLRRTSAARKRGLLPPAGLSEEIGVLRIRRTAADRHEVRTLVAEAEKAVSRRQFKTAEHCYIQALTVRQDDHAVQADLARLYLETGQPAKAEALYVEVLRHCDDPSCHANLGVAYYRLNRYEEAYEAYKRAYECDATPERAFSLARACLALRRYEEAVPLLEKAKTRFTRDTELLLLLGNAYLQTGKRDEAKDMFRHLHRMNPRDEAAKARLLALTSV